MKEPRLRITDPRFRYRNSAETDIRLTFRRVRLQQRLAERKAAALSNVAAMPLKKAAGGR